MESRLASFLSGKMKKNIRYLFLVLIALNFLIQIIPNLKLFTAPYDSAYWENRYLESGWAKGWASSENIGDAELYAYAGWKAVTGSDPTLINPEQPPLGKYLIGLSIIVFRNPVVISIIYGLLLIFVTYLISKQLIKDDLLALIPAVLLSFDGLFKENLITSMFDLPFALFISLSFLFLFKAQENRKYIIALVVSLAAVSLTKMYLVGFALTGVIFLYLLGLFLLFKRKDVFWFIASFPLFVLIYLGVYLGYFLNNHNLFDFKYYHFWIRHFARVQVDNYPQFEILRILLLGKWKTWWGESGIINVPAWSIFWPMATIIATVTGVISIIKMNYRLVILPIWIFSLIGMYTYGVPYPRYILPILPALYIVLVFSGQKLLTIKYGKN